MRAPDDRPVERSGAAGGPAELAPRSWLGALNRTARQFLEDHLLQWAAALAFFAVLSLFPALLALVSVLGLLGSSALEPLIENVSRLAPGAGRDIALGALRSIEESSDAAGATFVASLAVALWTASAYVGAFIPAANVVWDVDEARPMWKKLAVRLGLTLVLLILIALTAVTIVLTGPIAREVGALVGLGDTAVEVWQIAKWPFLALMLVLLLALLYWASPNVRHPGWRWVTPGSVLAVALWIAASLGFTLYVSVFGSLSAVYGSIGGVLVFLLWLWLSNIAILFGAELDAELERARAMDAGMRPVDRTPYLPLRDSGDDEEAT
jgi:membrane protein